MKVGHIAVYTENMEASVRFYQLLCGREGMRSTLDLGGGKSKDLLHMVFDGETTVELVCPSDKGMLPRVTGTCEHFCFNVEDDLPDGPQRRAHRALPGPSVSSSAKKTPRRITAGASFPS